MAVSLRKEPTKLPECHPVHILDEEEATRLYCPTKSHKELQTVDDKCETVPNNIILTSKNNIVKTVTQNNTNSKSIKVPTWLERVMRLLLAILWFILAYNLTINIDLLVDWLLIKSEESWFFQYFFMGMGQFYSSTFGKLIVTIPLYLNSFNNFLRIFVNDYKIL